MKYPLISEYVKAIQGASDNLDKLAYLAPVLDDHGEHIAVGVLVPWCLRCWTRVPENVMPSGVLRKNRIGELKPIVRLHMNLI